MLSVVASLAVLAAVPTNAATPPNIVILLVDDLGESGVAFNNPNVKGPRVQELRDEGIYLNRHYVYKFCSPTRGSLLTGRYPWRLGSLKSNFIPWSRPDGLSLGYDLLSQRLKRVGYTTHHVGKWHLGFHNSSFMPTSRGFDTFYGYLTGMEDHFDEKLNGFIECRGVVDLTQNALPALNQNGTYTGELYNSKAVQVIEAAGKRLRDDPANAAPFFLNMWFHNTHAPTEAPPEYIALYNFSDRALNTFNGMISVVDSAVGNITDALKRTGQWNNTLIIYTHDNGAPLGQGGSNYPLRGGKNSNFEGGVRVPAILSGGALPAARRGATVNNLFHVSDWAPTLIAAIGASYDPDPNADRIPVDGINQWKLLSEGVPDTQRNEIILDHCLANFSTASTGCNHFKSKREPGVGALIVGDMKLVAGPNGGEWTSYLNGTQSKSFNGVACDDFCIFNITADPSEHVDLKDVMPDVANQLNARFNEIVNEFHPDKYNPPAEDKDTCAAAAANGNFLVPWKSSGPPPAPSPAPAMGKCVGGPGSPGWNVLNNTGGGGPGYRKLKIKDLSSETVDKCRQECCADVYCVSVTLHIGTSEREDGCWFNAANGTVVPYPRVKTVLAYVNRTKA